MTEVDSVHLEQFHPSKGTTIYLIDYDLLGTGQVLYNPDTETSNKADNQSSFTP